MRRWVVLVFCLGAAFAAEPVDPRADVTYTEPVLRGLMDWVTLRFGFDHATVLPDMAAGAWTPKVDGTPQFAPGVRGQALVAGEGSAQLTLPRGANAPLGRRGALSLWLCPVDWDHQDSPYEPFLMTTNASFYLEWQGPQRGPDGHFTRLEALLYLAKDKGPLRTVAAGTNDWKNGVWHFVVCNWSWPLMSLSVDGGDFASTSLQNRVDEADFGDLVISNRGGKHTLLDEFTLYRRPLSLDEVRRLHQTFLPQEAPR